MWRRKSNIFTSTPGKPEKEVGVGRGCTIDVTKGRNIYAWTENDNVILVNSDNQKKVLGKGNQPVLKTLSDEKVICVWENDKEIHASVLNL